MMRFIHLIAVLCLFGSITVSHAEYIAVVDAGSSGTRLHVYSVEQQKVAEITPEHASPMTPPFAQLTAEPEAVRQYVAELLSPLVTASGTSNGIPLNLVHFYWYSTAGMRLVAPDRAEKLYTETKKVLQTYGFASVEAKTITGKMEGVYGWLTINYLKHTLFSNPKQTYGVLDTGGASTEITFAIKNATLIPPENAFKIEMGRHVIWLYTRSDLGLGHDLARLQHTEEKSCFSKNYPLPNEQLATGNFMLCKNSLVNLIKRVHKLNLPVMPESHRFYVLSTLYHLSTSAPFGFSTVLPLKSLAEKGKDVCDQDWKNLKLTYPDDSYLYSYCFGSAYYTALLTRGYHFTPESKFLIENEIDGNQLDWTLGVAVYKSLRRIH